MRGLQQGVPIPRLDAHQHFWSYNTAEYPWIPRGSALQRDWLPDDLAAEQVALGFEGSIAVQARQKLVESRWLLRLAGRYSRIRGVVGWVDLRSERVENELEELTRFPKLVGVRHVVQDEPDDFLLDPEFMRGIAALRAYDLTYDLLIHPRQLTAAIQLAAMFPERPFVVDHLAKPPIKSGALSPWREQITELAKSPNVACKVSGMITEADHAGWRPEDLKPYLDVVFEVFGIRRLMYGSDWPVCLLAGSYEQAFRAVEEYVAQFSAAEQAEFFGGNAARFYAVE